MNGVTRRRGFIHRAAAAVGALAIWPNEPRTKAASPDESWLQGLNGKHRQMFDVAVSRGGRPLGRVANFLDAYVEAYDLKDADLSAVVGVHGDGVFIALDDAMWSKYEIGKRNSEIDPRTGAPAIRNPWARDGQNSVARLQERGVRFVVCMRSIRRLSGELAPSRGAADGVRDELLRNLLPGVTPVPAMIVAVNRAQEAGLTYAYLG